MEGAKGAVCGPMGVLLADKSTSSKHSKCHLYLPRPIHACPRHGSWATLLAAKSCKVEGASSPRSKMGIYKLRKHRPTRIAGGWHWADNPIYKKTIVTKSEEAIARLTLLRWNGKRLKDLRLGSWNVLTLSGGWSGLNMYCMLVTREQWRRYLRLRQRGPGKLEDLRWDGKTVSDRT